MKETKIDTKKESALSNEGLSNTYIEDMVSIIMPMHNSASFLSEAIESVLAQTYKNWELLIIDDASTDDSINIARDYEMSDSRIHLLINDNHIGIPSAPRNVGLKAAKGRFIAFLDSDDLYFPQKLELQLPLFESNDVTIVYANYEKMKEDGTRSNRVIFAPQFTTFKDMLKGNVITMPAGIYDRSKVGTVFMQDKRHEDYVMWLEILKKGGIAKNSNSVVAAVRVRGTSVSSNKQKAIVWQWKVYREVEKLSFLQSAYYFSFYAFKALAKSLI